MTNFTIVQTEQLPALVDRLSTALAKAEADADEWYMLFQAEEDRAEKAEAELAAAVAHNRMWRESVTEALNRSPEYWYDKHENGLSAVEHAAHAIDALFAERDAERARAEKAEAERIAERTTRIAKTEELVAHRAEVERLNADRDRLIAQLADLLKALKEVVRISDRKHDAWDAARAAIAKAEGQCNKEKEMEQYLRNQQLRAEWIRASGQQAALQSLNPGGRDSERARADRYLAALRSVTIDCGHLHHTPADRHSATAPCPVEAAEDSAAEWDRMERKVRDIAWLAKCVRDQILSMRDDANRFDEGTAHGVNWKHDPGNILRSHAHWLEKMLQQLELRS